LQQVIVHHDAKATQGIGGLSLIFCTAWND